MGDVLEKIPVRRVFLLLEVRRLGSMLQQLATSNRKISVYHVESDAKVALMERHVSHATQKIRVGNIG